MVNPEYAANAKMTWGGSYLMIMTPDVKTVADGEAFPDRSCAVGP